MNHNIPNQLPGKTSKSALYLPKYRHSVKKPSYALDIAKDVQIHREVDNVFKHLEAIEQWRRREESHLSGCFNVRWKPEKLRELHLHIMPPPKSNWSKLILESAQVWEASSAGRLRFINTVRPEEADIIIEWVDNPIPGREYEVGHTNRNIHPPHWIASVKISLLKRPIIDNHISQTEIDDRLFATALHELGHGLGLEHSSHPRDVMHHRGWRNCQLSRNDIEAFEQLYANNQTAGFWL